MIYDHLLASFDSSIENVTTMFDHGGNDCQFFAMVFPDDVHIPQLAVGESGEVKTVVVKVPVG